MTNNFFSFLLFFSSRKEYCIRRDFRNVIIRLAVESMLFYYRYYRYAHVFLDFARGVRMQTWVLFFFSDIFSVDACSLILLFLFIFIYFIILFFIF